MGLCCWFEGLFLSVQFVSFCYLSVLCRILKSKFTLYSEKTTSGNTRFNTLPWIISKIKKIQNLTELFNTFETKFLYDSSRIRFHHSTWTDWDTASHFKSQNIAPFWRLSQKSPHGSMFSVSALACSWLACAARTNRFARTSAVLQKSSCWLDVYGGYAPDFSTLPLQKVGAKLMVRLEEVLCNLFTVRFGGAWKTSV